MRTVGRFIVFLLCFSCGVATVQAAQEVDFSGTYRLTGPEGTLTITLRQTGDAVMGKLVDDAGNTMLVEGDVDEGEFSGFATFGEQRIEVFAELQGRDTLVWIFEIQEGYEQEFILQRQRGSGPEPPRKPAGGNPLGGGGKANPLATGSPFVGSFEKPDGSLKLTVRQQGQGFAGTLTVRDAAGTTNEFPMQLRAEGSDLVGTFGSGAGAYPISVRFDPEAKGGQLVVTSGDFVHRLDRKGGGVPPAGSADATGQGSYRHPQGWFTSRLPKGWRALIEEPAAVVLDAGRPGAFIFVLCSHLDPEEIGQPVPVVFQEALPDLDGVLARNFGIQADSTGARATALTPSHHPAAEVSWSGRIPSDWQPQPVTIWSGTVFEKDFFVLLIAVLNPGDATSLVPELRGVLGSTRVLQVPTPAEFERFIASSAQPSEDPLAQTQGQKAQYSRRITVNGTRIDDATLQILEQGMGIQIPEYDYWYDPVCGAVGGIGGPGVAFFPPGLRLGGPLQPDASGGGSGMVTGVFINGRELHPQDVLGLKSITGQVIPGRYWLDGQGNFGFEGGPVAGNLLLIARTRQTQGGGGGSQAWTRYKDFGGVNGKTNFGSFGNGDYYFSGGGVDWWPGK
jgi:hypothetical protein